VQRSDISSGRLRSVSNGRVASRDISKALAALHIWFKNAQVYEELSCERAPRESERIALLTMIEAIRFDAMVPPPPGEPYEFDVSAYGFAEDVLAYRSRVIEVVLRQEAASPSFYEPLAPE